MLKVSTLILILGGNQFSFPTALPPHPALKSAYSGPFLQLHAPASWQALNPAEKAQQRAPFSHCQAE